LISAYDTGKNRPGKIGEYSPLATDNALIDMIKSPDEDVRAFFAAHAFTISGQQLINRVGEEKGWFFDNITPQVSNKNNPYDRFREYKEQFQKHFRFYVFWLEGNNRSIGITCLYNKVKALDNGSVVLDKDSSNLLTEAWCNMTDEEFSNWTWNEHEGNIDDVGVDVMEGLYKCLEGENDNQAADLQKPVDVIMMCLEEKNDFKTAHDVEEKVLRHTSRSVAKDKQESSTSTSSQVIGRIVNNQNRRQFSDNVGVGGGKYLIKSDEQEKGQTYCGDELFFRKKGATEGEGILEHPLVSAITEYLTNPEPNAEGFLAKVSLVGKGEKPFNLPAKASVTNLFRPKNPDNVKNTPLDLNALVMVPLLGALLAKYGKGKNYEHVEALHIALGDIGMNSGAVHHHATNPAREEELGKLNLTGDGSDTLFWTTVLFLADMCTVTGADEEGHNLFGTVMDKVTDLERDNNYNFEAVLGEYQLQMTNEA
jgi:hypothetical protein